MGSFIQRHRDHVTGVLSGFDRLVLRGTLRTLSYTAGMMNFLYESGVLLKEFGGYVERTTKQLRAACYEKAEQLNRPVIYLPSSQPSKEALAQQIAARDAISEGLICLLSCVEPCLSYDVSSQPPFPNRAKQGCQRVPACDAGVRQRRTPAVPAVAV